MTTTSKRKRPVKRTTTRRKRRTVSATAARKRVTTLKRKLKVAQKKLTKVRSAVRRRRTAKK